jgi:hypothetical protein
MDSDIPHQIAYLFLLALPIACVTWTITHEEIFKEIREICVLKSKQLQAMWRRKFFYVFTCEYCFSHYVTAMFLFITQYHLLYSDWKGYLVGGFALVWIANFYMSLFGFIRVGMKKEKMDADLEELKLKAEKKKKAA